MIKVEILQHHSKKKEINFQQSHKTRLKVIKTILIILSWKQNQTQVYIFPTHLAS